MTLTCEQPCDYPRLRTRFHSIGFSWGSRVEVRARLGHCFVVLLKLFVWVLNVLPVSHQLTSSTVSFAVKTTFTSGPIKTIGRMLVSSFMFHDVHGQFKQRLELMSLVLLLYGRLSLVGILGMGPFLTYFTFWCPTNLAMYCEHDSLTEFESCPLFVGLGQATKYVAFEGRQWHADCFQCAECQKSLLGQGFLVCDSKVVCPDCGKNM